MQLPHALDPPETAVVDGTDRRRRGPECLEQALDQGVVDRRGDGAEREQRRRQSARGVEREEIDQHDEKDAEPAREQKDPDRLQVEAVLGGEAAPQRVAGAQVIEAAVALDRARDLERRRAQQADVLADLAVDRHHHLGAQQAVVAGTPARGVVDVVADEIARADSGARHAERRARDIVIEHVEAVGDHRAGADRSQKRIRRRDFAAEIRAGLQDWVEPPAHPLQKVDDEGAVAEQQREEARSGEPADHAVDRVVQAIEWIGRVRLDEPAHQPRHDAEGEQSDEHEAEEEDYRDRQGFDHEAPRDQRRYAGRQDVEASLQQRHV